ncbi:hypothetical protein H4Q32_026547 [Labeo rohita]|uniref:Ribosomal RNA-processing protein 7 C-terminal domain-containing protein n=1 Tax=Labeo rohita TaxID=84645 RepID=A0ABQ8MY94_LABRO|nr:hypothetical protein H4Q32_026547 [Labeo rohita]
MEIMCRRWFSDSEWICSRCSQEAELQQEDEEGWVKVMKGSHGVKLHPHSETANERTLQEEKKKKERKELLNFYTWQHRNTLSRLNII